MGSGNNNNSETERRTQPRRVNTDRRVVVRFEDVLGRRSGVERRLSDSQHNKAQAL